MSFLLEQLSKEAREAVKELALDEANKRDQLLAGALNPTGPGGGHLGDVPDPSKKLSLDAIVARQYAEKQAAAAAAQQTGAAAAAAATAAKGKDG